MSKLEKYLAKAQEPIERKTEVVVIDGDEWEVRQLSLSEERDCFRRGEDKDGNLDYYKYNDARIVRATEHQFPWHNIELLKAYGAKDKFEMPEKMFNGNRQAYRELLAAVTRVNSNLKTEQEQVEELKNSSEQTENPGTSAKPSSTEEEGRLIS